MSKYRNIPQATKDNVLHYINQVYDEAYELGYQRGRVQSDRDIKSAQQMIEDAIKNLHELKQEPKRGKWIDVEYQLGMQCSECGKMCNEITLCTDMMTEAHWNYCPNCGSYNGGDNE